MSYSKLHQSIVNSSLWVQPSPTRVLFITLLAIADRDGYVYGSREGLARVANIDPEECDAAWQTLLSPDPDSSDLRRVPGQEGRRVEITEGGFRILNYTYYRGLRNDDDRREQNKAAQARYRQRHKPTRTVSRRQPESATVSPGQPQSAQAEAEAEEVRTEIVPTEGRERSSTTPDATEMSYLAFPTIGTGPKVWSLTIGQVTEWEAAYPGVNVLGECQKALAWVNANTKKTARGMPAFLVRWLNRAVNDARLVTPSRPANRAPQFSYQGDWTCPHTPHCTGRQACQTRQDIDQYKRSQA